MIAVDVVDLLRDGNTTHEPNDAGRMVDVLIMADGAQFEKHRMEELFAAVHDAEASGRHDEVVWLFAWRTVPRADRALENLDLPAAPVKREVACYGKTSTC